MLCQLTVSLCACVHAHVPDCVHACVRECMHACIYVFCNLPVAVAGRTARPSPRRCSWKSSLKTYLPLRGVVAQPAVAAVDGEGPGIPTVRDAGTVWEAEDDRLPEADARWTTQHDRRQNRLTVYKTIDTCK